MLDITLIDGLSDVTKNTDLLIELSKNKIYVASDSQD